MKVGKFKTIKKLLELDGTDELSYIDIAATTGASLSAVHRVDSYDSYYLMPENKTVYKSRDGLFSRILLDDYGNGRKRLSCTNHKRHKTMHSKGKCYLSSIWSDETIESNGYIKLKE